MSRTIKDIDRKIDLLVVDLKEETGDPESAHIVLDEILELIAEKHDPELLAEIKEIYGDTDRWYA